MKNYGDQIPVIWLFFCAFPNRLILGIANWKKTVLSEKPPYNFCLTSSFAKLVTRSGKPQKFFGVTQNVAKFAQCVDIIFSILLIASLTLLCPLIHLNNETFRFKGKVWMKPITVLIDGSFSKKFRNWDDLRTEKFKHGESTWAGRRWCDQTWSSKKPAEGALSQKLSDKLVK